MIPRIIPASSRVYYFYILFRPNGIPCYVGKGKGNRWLEHEKMGAKHPNIHLRNIILEAQKSGKELPKIKLRENLTEAEAFKLEKIFIKALGREKDGGCLVNSTNGGEGFSGLVFTSEHRAKMRAARRRRPHNSKEQNRSISLALKGKPKTPEHRAAAGLAQRGGTKKSGWWSTEEGRAKQRANNPGHTGHKHTQETKALIRAKTKAARARQAERDRVEGGSGLSAHL